MLRAYLLSLFDIASRDDKVLHIIADSGTGNDELFSRDFPAQFLDFGIQEQNLIGAACGLASCGKIPFVFTASAFLIYRAFEFIRDDACFQNENIKIIGMGSGLSWSTLGATHHTTEDIALLRTMPNLTVLSPACPSEVDGCVKYAYQVKGPVYLRLGMGGEKELYSEPIVFDPTDIPCMRKGKNTAVFFTGAIGNDVMRAASQLAEYGIDISVYNMHTISQLPEKKLYSILQNYQNVYSVEEHSVRGGIGGILSEVIAKNGLAVRCLPIGIDGGFAKGYGKIEQVRAENHLNDVSIASFIKHNS